MNIAHLIPATVRYPLSKHNGRYEWVLRLAQAQAASGHVVTIYCAPGSTEPTGKVNWGSLPTSSGSGQERNIAHYLHAFSNPEHQIFHSHFDSLHYQVASDTTKPIVATQHWFPNEHIAADALHDGSRRITTVAVTDYMRHEDVRLGIPCSQVIHHGIDLSLFNYSAAPRTDRLLFVGRIAPHKGVMEAVRIADDIGAELDIVGKVNTADKAYWESIVPYIDGERIRYLGSKSHPEVAALMRTAKAMLFLPQQIEAFGQTIVETQACGTAVIVNDLGANKELMSNGKTGFVVDGSAADMAAALRNLPALESTDCREFATSFDQRLMFQAYASLYRQLVDRS